MTISSRVSSGISLVGIWIFYLGRDLLFLKPFHAFFDNLSPALGVLPGIFLIGQSFMPQGQARRDQIFQFHGHDVCPDGVLLPRPGELQLFIGE